MSLEKFNPGGKEEISKSDKEIQPLSKDPSYEDHLSGEEGLSLLTKSTRSLEGPVLKEILNTPEGRKKYETKRIVLAGPPRSGKSCLREGLKQIIKSIPDAPYPYVLTACPDGEGAWFQETMNNNPELAKVLKEQYKSRFTPEFVERIEKSVKNISAPDNPLNFIDIGGIITPENERICKNANGVILVCGETAVKTDLPAQWKSFFAKLGIPIIAEVYSDYFGQEDYIKGVDEKDGVFRGAVHHLERGEDLTKRQTLKALGEFIVNYDKESREKLNSYEVALLDPRPNADNSKIFEGKDVYGIEVTIPELAERCNLGNLDPQHLGGDHTRAAIEDAIHVELPSQDSRLVTIRPDLDSLGSMAILNLRQNGIEITPGILEKIGKIAKKDTFTKGEWPGVRELPSKENLWPEGKSELAPLDALCSDFKVSVTERVTKIQEWFEKNIILKEYTKLLEDKRKNLVEALESGDISIKAMGGIAYIESTHRGSIELGYRKAPIVIMSNPKFQFQGGEPHLKYTIAQFTNDFVDMKAVLEELKAKEPGWGGSPTIIGSPQGISSKLSSEEIIKIVQRNKKINNEVTEEKHTADFYIEKALKNLSATSRTAQGEIDVSASSIKTEKVVDDLSSTEIATIARDNFIKVIQDLYEHREDQIKTPEQLRQFIESVSRQINHGLTKEDIMIRDFDSPIYPYIKTENLEESMNEFYMSLLKRINDKNSDPIETAAFVEFRIDLTDHFFADGCGKTAKAISSWVLMRNNQALPSYRDRKEYYAHAPKVEHGQDKEIDQEQWEKWTKYYRSLFNESE